MKATGIKFICECKHGDINTWHDVLHTTVDEIINKVKYQKGWIGGKFTDIYLEFDNDGKYYKVHLDIAMNGFNKLLGT